LKATFGAGCFWHVEDLFRKTKGVTSTKVGYTGGNLTNPTYEEVCTDKTGHAEAVEVEYDPNEISYDELLEIFCTDKTGHAEAVEVEYDPNEISYDELLEIFWNNHDPTSLNRQGPDVGIQYRSSIFFHDETQKQTAQKSKEKLNSSGKFSKSIVTEIVPSPEFYKAEEYHQKYFQKHGLS
jgi:peptide-methionine (S)-S-oxide reductase